MFSNIKLHNKIVDHISDYEKQEKKTPTNTRKTNYKQLVLGGYHLKFFSAREQNKQYE